MQLQTTTDATPFVIDDVSVTDTVSNRSVADRLSNSTSGSNDDNYYNFDDNFFDWHAESSLPTMLYVTLYDVVAVFGVIGNVMILVVMRHRSLRTISYTVYLRFLAVSDLVVIVFRVVEVNLDRFQNLFQRMVTWNLRFCQSFMLFRYWSVFLSLWLVVAITCDRFISVASPLKWKMTSTKTKTFYTCVAFAVLTLLFNLSTFYTVGLVPDEFDSSKFFCTFRVDIRIIADVLTFVLGSVLPCVVIFLVNMLTLFQIRLSKRERDDLTQGRNNLTDLTKGRNIPTAAGERGRVSGRNPFGQQPYVLSEDSMQGTFSLSTESGSLSFTTAQESAHLSGTNQKGPIFMSAESASLSLMSREEESQQLEGTVSASTAREVCPHDKRVTTLPRKDGSVVTAEDVKICTGKDDSSNVKGNPDENNISKAAGKDVTEGKCKDTKNSADSEDLSEIKKRLVNASGQDMEIKNTSTLSPETTSSQAANTADKKDGKIQNSTANSEVRSNFQSSLQKENPSAGKGISSLSSDCLNHQETNRINKKEVKFHKNAPKSPNRSNTQTPANNKRSGQDKAGKLKKTVRVDRATVCLTYISVSALLTMAPYGIMHGLFMVFLDQWDARLAVDPWTPVPLKLQNLIRIWDLLELIMLFNFSQNFYILLLTNKQVYQTVKNWLGCAPGKKKSMPK